MKDAFKAALPIMLGYCAIGLPCGILEDTIGMSPLQVFLLCLFLYSGAGQFMIPNMTLAGSSIPSIIGSVSLVNTRHLLYGAAFAPECSKTKSKLLAIFFAGSVTDETYGINQKMFHEGGWTVDRALMVNLLSQSAWTITNVIGCVLGSTIAIPVDVAAFAMTAIFICLLLTQEFIPANLIAMVVAMAGVTICKIIGLSGASILIGALGGVLAAMIYTLPHRGKKKMWHDK